MISAMTVGLLLIAIGGGLIWGFGGLIFGAGLGLLLICVIYATQYPRGKNP